MTDISPFVISISDEQITDLKNRIANTRWPDAETTSGWNQGVPLAYVKELVQYWGEQYDQQRLANRLNTFDNFKTNLLGLNIHFMHIKSSNPNARPLLLTHGWPGSVVEFLKVIGPLTEPQDHGGTADDAFHLVIPSLPGYGFSDKPEATGWGVEKIADAWSTLMARLGYSQYFAQRHIEKRLQWFYFRLEWEVSDRSISWRDTEATFRFSGMSLEGESKR